MEWLKIYRRDKLIIYVFHWCDYIFSFLQVVGVYTTQLQKTSSTPILLDANTTVTTCSSEDFDGDVGDDI